MRELWMEIVHSWAPARVGPPFLGPALSHNLLGLKGSSIAGLEVVQSHVMALGKYVHPGVQVVPNVVSVE